MTQNKYPATLRNRRQTFISSIFPYRLQLISQMFILHSDIDDVLLQRFDIVLQIVDTLHQQFRVRVALASQMIAGRFVGLVSVIVAADADVGAAALFLVARGHVILNRTQSVAKTAKHIRTFDDHS